MEVQLVIFLASTSAAVAINAILMWLAYKGFASLASKVTQTMADFERNTQNRAWIESMQVAAEQAVRLTEATKQRVAEFEPAIGRAHEKYTLALTKIDSKFEGAADEISTGAKKMRDAVAKPAFSVISFAAGLGQTLKDWQQEDER